MDLQEQMDRMTLKSSTIFISVGSRTRVYHSMDEVPLSLRKQLEQSTNSINSATILIADKRGREEIVRTLRGLPTDLRSRLTSSLAKAGSSNKNIPAAKPVEDRLPEFLTAQSSTSFLSRYWVEFAVPAGVGVLIWITLHLLGR
ncbi:MAG: hypothetical protein ABI823_08390 [Bryobacteraceae bacterium]